MKLLSLVTASSLVLGQFCEGIPFENNEFNLVVIQPSGENTVLTFDKESSFLEIMQQAELLARDESSDEDQDKRTYFLDCHKSSFNIQTIAKTSTSVSRNYEAALTASEKEDIAFIVISLGRASLKKLLGLKSSLKKAGARVDHVHPLKFLYTIFSDEENKVAILQIKERGGWVGKEFFNGVFDSLTEEAKLDNLKEDYIIDFANQLDIDPLLISKPIEERDWKGLIHTLIDLLPRKGNPNRYDM